MGNARVNLAVLGRIRKKIGYKVGTNSDFILNPFLVF
jgi:hypothetical protein